MKLKFFTFFLCITALSFWKLEGFPTLQSQDSNLSEPVLQGKEIHVLRHVGLNRTKGLGAKCDQEGDEKQDKIFLSKKSKSGKGAYGGGNIVHHPRQAKNAALSLVSPPFFMSTVVLHISLTVILVFPSLFLKLF